MSADSPYTDSNGVLFNRLGLKDAQALHDAEANITRVRMAELKEHPIQGRFDTAHLRAIHKAIFKDVYEWAGEPRTVNMQKGESVFAFAQHIESSANKLLHQLARENHLKDLDKTQFVERAAFYMSELNAVHPFREGNGRAQRVFFEHLGREAGHSLDLSAVSRQMMNVSSEKAHLSGDSRHLQPVFQQALRAEQHRGLDR